MIEYIFDLRFLISIFVIYFIYRYGNRKHNLHLKIGARGPKPYPFIGNLLALSLQGMHEFDRMCSKKFGKIYPQYLGGIGTIMITDEEIMKQVLIKEFKCFTDRMDLGFKTKTTEKMLTILQGKDWERVRNLISPTFTSGKLKKMSPLLADCLSLLLKRLHDNPPGVQIEVKELFAALTMDSIARTMFGMKIDSQTNPNNLFIVNAKKLFNFSILTPLAFLIIIFPILGRLILKIFPDFELIGSGTMEFFSVNIKKAIEERKNSKECHNDFLALMLRAEKEADEDGRYLTYDEIIAQSLIFLIAGYETTAQTLSFVSYFLAKNPEIQQQLYEELTDSIGSDGEISYDVVMKMPLMDAVVNETLRLCPPAIRFDRVCTKDVDLVASDGRVIRARVGDVFTIPVFAIHTDPEIWPQPDSFDVNRWIGDSKGDRSAYSFLPFGIGPRNCVGMRFALLEVKWALATIVRDFEMVPCAQTLDKLKFKKMGLTQPAKPIVLSVVRRQP